MKYRPLGKTGFQVSILGLGASPLGGAFGPVDEKDGIKTVQTAVDLGINFIDVAPFHGSTRAETILGKALKDIPRTQYWVATKVGRYGTGPQDIDYSAARVVRSVDESLRRLKLSHIDLIQCQDIELAPESQLFQETIPALLALKTTGKVRHIGVSAYPLDILRKAAGQSGVEVVQSYCRFCLTDITLVQVVTQMKSRKVGLINASPFAMGLLTEKGPPEWHPATPVYREVCRKAVDLCKKRRRELPKVALQFAVSNPDIPTTLVGTSSPKKLKQDVGWIQDPLEESLLVEVQETLKPILNRSWDSVEALPVAKSKVRA